MIRRFTFALFSVVLLFSIFTGCGKHYTRTADITLQNKLIPHKNLGVMPLTNLVYNPPTSCLSTSSGTEEQFEQEFMQKLMANLSSRFPGQQWHTINSKHAYFDTSMVTPEVLAGLLEHAAHELEPLCLRRVGFRLSASARPV